MQKQYVKITTLIWPITIPVSEVEDVQMDSTKHLRTFVQIVSKDVVFATLQLIPVLFGSNVVSTIFLMKHTLGKIIARMSFYKRNAVKKEPILTFSNRTYAPSMEMFG